MVFGPMFWGFSQPGKSWKKNFKQAETYLESGYLSGALKYAEVAAVQAPAELEIHTFLAELYVSLSDYALAAEKYQYLINHAYEDYPTARLSLAEMMIAQGDYSDAMAELEVFIQNYFGNGSNRLKAQAESLKSQCMWALAQGSNTKIKLTTSRINDSADQCNPLLTPQGYLLYKEFTFNKEYELYPDLESPALNTLVGTEWLNSKHQVFPGPYLDETWQVESFALSPDGKHFVFSAVIEDEEATEFLYLSERKGKSWTAPKQISKVNSDGYNSKHPFLYEQNGNLFLMYTSDRHGGFGGFDIWVAQFNQKGQIKETYKLSNVVNSEYDEFTPFYDIDFQQLTFASDRPEGFGNTDLYRAEGSADTWSTPKNLGLPLNSSADDLHFFRMDEQGFISSNRSYAGKPSTRDFDILNFEVKNFKVSGCIASSGSALPDAELELFAWNDGSWLLMATSFSGNQECNDEGNYSFLLKPQTRYRLVVQKELYDSTYHEFSTMGFNDPKTIEVSVTLDPQILLELNARSSSGDHMNEVYAEIFQQDELGQWTLFNSGSVGNTGEVFDLASPGEWLIKCQSQGHFKSEKTITISENEIPGTFKETVTLDRINADEWYSFGKVTYLTADSSFNIAAVTEIEDLTKILNSNVELSVELQPAVEPEGDQEENEVGIVLSEIMLLLESKGIPRNRIINEFDFEDIEETDVFVIDFDLAYRFADLTSVDIPGE